MRIALPVVCQNGHKAMSHYWFNSARMEFIWELPSIEETCSCPKSNFGEGWRTAGNPFVVEE
jgi:hypothetical protein